MCIFHELGSNNYAFGVVSHSRCVEPEPKPENNNDNYLLGLKIFVPHDLIIFWFSELESDYKMTLDAYQGFSNSDYGTSLPYCSVAHHTCIRNILSCESFQETDLIIISWIWGSLIIRENRNALVNRFFSFLCFRWFDECIQVLKSSFIMAWSSW